MNVKNVSLKLSSPTLNQLIQVYHSYQIVLDIELFFTFQSVGGIEELIGSGLRLSSFVTFHSV